MPETPEPSTESPHAHEALPVPPVPDQCPRCGAKGVVSAEHDDAEGRPQYECPICEAIWGPVVEAPAPLARARSRSPWVVAVIGILVLGFLTQGLWQDLFVADPEDDDPFAPEDREFWGRVASEVDWTGDTTGSTQLLLQRHAAGLANDSELVLHYGTGATAFLQHKGSAQGWSTPEGTTGVRDDVVRMLDWHHQAYLQWSAHYTTRDADARTAAEHAAGQAAVYYFGLQDRCRTVEPCHTVAGLDPDAVQLRLRIDNRLASSVFTQTFALDNDSLQAGSGNCGSQFQSGALEIEVEARSRAEGLCTTRYPAGGQLLVRTSWSAEDPSLLPTPALFELTLDLQGVRGVDLLVTICPDGSGGAHLVTGGTAIRILDGYESRPPTCA